MVDGSKIKQFFTGRKDFVDDLSKLGIRSVSVIFVAYIGASIASTLVVMVLIDSAIPKERRKISASSSQVRSVNLSNSTNYRDLRKDVMDRSLFNSDGEYPEEADPNSQPDEEQVADVFDDSAPCKKTSLPIDLLGTIYLGDTGESLATVKEKGYSVADVYRNGDPIIGNEQAKIYRVEQKRIVINNSGSKECLELIASAALGGYDTPSTPAGRPGGTTADAGGGASPSGCSNVELKEDYVAKELGDGYGEILKKGRLIPFNNSDSEMVGFKLIGVKKNSLFTKACLKNGDVITQVNDESMRQPEKGFSLYDAFQNERDIRISLLRNGKKPMTISVQIK